MYAMYGHDVNTRHMVVHLLEDWCVMGGDERGVWGVWCGGCSDEWKL